MQFGEVLSPPSTLSQTIKNSLSHIDNFLLKASATISITDNTAKASPTFKKLYSVNGDFSMRADGGF